MDLDPASWGGLELGLKIWPVKTSNRSHKTAPVAAIPVNPFRWSNSAKHDVTMTSLTADLL